MFHEPGTSTGVLNGEFPELLVHFPIEVSSEEEGPETEQGVHFLTLALTHLGSI